MELKSLILGLVLSMGAFAVKSGAGTGYAMAGTDSLLKRILIFTGITSCYAGIFLLTALIPDLTNIGAWYGKLEVLFKSGMMIHMILAWLLAFWGIKLLIRNPTDRGRTRAWLALALPCPVCFSVILLNTGLVTTLYPDRPDLIWWLFSGFVLVSLITALGVPALGRRRETENILGAVMLYMAAYFALCVTIIPQFGDLETIYRLSRPASPSLLVQEAAAGSAPGFKPVAIPGAVLPAAGGVLALAAGFFNPFRKRD
ncbi:MAG: DUF2162 domain-containing protein [Desulfobacterales bacterium]|nr:DUF2162 domain-containing protein [Desulfobacterales bacterium]